MLHILRISVAYFLYVVNRLLQKFEKVVHRIAFCFAHVRMKLLHQFFVFSIMCFYVLNCAIGSNKNSLLNEFRLKLPMTGFEPMNSNVSSNHFTN